MTSTLVQGHQPAAEFTMLGVDGFEGGRLQAVVIGDEAWLKEGSGGWQKSPGGAADFDAAFTTLSPIDLTTGFEDISAGLVAAGTGRKNGIRARHYHADGSNPTVAAAGLTTGAADAWLAVDGGYLVAFAVSGTWDVDGDADAGDPPDRRQPGQRPLQHRPPARLTMARPCRPVRRRSRFRHRSTGARGLPAIVRAWTIPG